MRLTIPLAMITDLWQAALGAFQPHFHRSDFFEAAMALAVLLGSFGFLYLVWRVCWGVERFTAASLERAHTERRLAEMLSQLVEAHQRAPEQLWSASAALSPC
jgi:hypothetical protein